MKISSLLLSCTNVLAPSPAMSRNMNFCGKAKYSLSRRKPEKLRAGQGSSASSGAKPTSSIVVLGSSTGAMSFGVSARATPSVCAASSSIKLQGGGAAAQEQAQPVHAELR